MSRGFTIIEFLTVMSLIALLSLIVFAGRGKEEARLALQRSAFQLSQDLREVQEMAMGAQEKECSGGITYSFGFYFHPQTLPQSYLIFADCNLNHHKDSSDPILKEKNLEKGVEIYSLYPSPLTIVFLPPEPQVFINGQSEGVEAIITLALTSDSEKISNQKRVKLNSVGRIEIE